MNTVGDLLQFSEEKLQECYGIELIIRTDGAKGRKKSVCGGV